MIADLGFLDRWNDTMATELERSPLSWADEHLQGRGWSAGKHSSRTPEAR